ncbi:MAG: VanZ family protein [Nocardioides sp.]|uniref:VanZ family protein n=1 Tax=Nocardioides sp. TaxID=35761 RepID=UPI003F0C51B6
MLDQVGGTESMVLGALGAAAVAVVVGLVLRRWMGWVSGWALAGLLWWLAVIALVTLVPLGSIDLLIPEGQAPTTCSTDYGGPAPDGFWILGGTQRTLNTVLFVPAGLLLVLAAARWRAGWVLVPLGLALLAGYSVGLEFTQLELARIGRACDVTDVVDNATGAAIGVGVGLLLLPVLRPWSVGRTR